jgi:membrane fusion protein, multidrug efflux system
VANDQEFPGSAAAARNSKPFIIRHWKALAVLVVFILGMIVLVRYIQQKQPVGAGPQGGRAASSGPGRTGQNGPVAVAAAIAAVGDIDVKIPALGTVTPLATVTVRTQISGVMQKIFFTEGQLVKQGATLAQIDPRPYEAAVQQQQGNLKRDQALLADAKLDLKRYEGLVKEDSIAEQQLDTQRDCARWTKATT